MANSDSSTAESDESAATDGDGTAGDDAPAGARMMLEPDAIHEETDEPSLDCPQCGSTVSLVQIIEEGRCAGRLESENAEAEGDDQPLQEGGCDAELSLELVWEA